MDSPGTIAPAPSPAPSPRRGPSGGWPWWTAPLALIGGLVLAAVGALVVDIPAAILGVQVTSSHIPGGLEIVDTVIQDVGFILAAVLCAGLGGRVVRAWQFGLRPPRVGWRKATLAIVALVVGFLLFSAIWAAVLNSDAKDKVLEQLGTNEGTALLLASALLTCVIAPICEEFLFRGFIFTALSSWRGPWPAAVLTGLLFGGVHAGSAPAVDLLPLAALGFGLCLLYRYSGSLYPCMLAHSLNNSLAFGGLEEWGWQILVLMPVALVLIGLIVHGFKRTGLIAPPPGESPEVLVASEV